MKEKEKLEKQKEPDASIDDSVDPLEVWGEKALKNSRVDRDDAIERGVKGTAGIIENLERIFPNK